MSIRVEFRNGTERVFKGSCHFQEVKGDWHIFTRKTAIKVEPTTRFFSRKIKEVSRDVEDKQTIAYIRMDEVLMIEVAT
jgi:hypothetical protein